MGGAERRETLQGEVDVGGREGGGKQVREESGKGRAAWRAVSAEVN